MSKMSDLHYVFILSAELQSVSAFTRIRRWFCHTWSPFPICNQQDPSQVFSGSNVLSRFQEMAAVTCKPQPDACAPCFTRTPAPLHTCLQLFAHENLSICSTPQLWRNCLHGAGALCSLWRRAFATELQSGHGTVERSHFVFRGKKFLELVKSKTHFNPSNN